MTCPCCSRPLLDIWQRLILWAIGGVLTVLTIAVVWWARGVWDMHTVRTAQAEAKVAKGEAQEALKVADGVVRRDIARQLAEKGRR